MNPAGFPGGNFVIEVYSRPYRLDGDSNGGGIMLHFREVIHSDLLAAERKIS